MLYFMKDLIKQLLKRVYYKCTQNRKMNNEHKNTNYENGIGQEENIKFGRSVLNCQGKG